MKYRDYQNARDAAWKLLIDYNIKSLPINIFNVCNKIGVTLNSYEDGYVLLKELGLEKQCMITDVFTKLYKGRYYIFFNNHMSRQRIRFTIAHEIGHIALSHLQEKNTRL